MNCPVGAWSTLAVAAAPSGFQPVRVADPHLAGLLDVAVDAGARALPHLGDLDAVVLGDRAERFGVSRGSEPCAREVMAQRVVGIETLIRVSPIASVRPVQVFSAKPSPAPSSTKSGR